MSDAAQNLENVNETKPSYQELEDRLNAVLAKHDELLTEAKTAKREKARIESERQEHERKLAEKNGEFEKLWKTVSDEKEQLKQQLKDIKNANRQDKLSAAAMKVSAELAEGYNVELLSEFVKRKLEHIAEEDGSINQDVIEAVAAEFKNNEKFKSLLRGSKASGGGAPGNTKAGGEKSTLTRAEFERLSPQKQFEFVAKVRSGSAELKDTL